MVCDSCYREFLRSLATFPKPLVAGVQGSAVGLGVTMLPLFDLVLASDKATFSTPYGRLGHVPEGIAFLTLPNLLGSTLVNSLQIYLLDATVVYNPPLFA